jgi:hypothetical protein
MGSCRVVRPETVRLSLSDGDWIDVIKELNAGEYLDLITATAERKPFAKILTYLIGWSLVGFEGQPLPYSLQLPETERRDLVRSLNKATLRELVAVLNRHEAAEEEALEKKRTTTTGAPASSAPSTSAAP